MSILIAFVPFIVFVILERLFGYTAGLSAAAVTSTLLIAKDLLGKHTLKVLELGTLISSPDLQCMQRSSTQRGRSYRYGCAWTRVSCWWFLPHWR